MSFAAVVNSLIAFGNFVIIPVIIAIAGLVFLWGILQFFILSGGDAEKQGQGRSFALWGLIALAVMFSAWGLVNVLLATFGI